MEGQEGLEPLEVEHAQWACEYSRLSLDGTHKL